MSPSSLRLGRVRWRLSLCLGLSMIGGASWLAATAQSVSAGQSHSAVLETSGTLALWGYNGYGQIGDATNTPRPVPTEITGAWQAVSLGSNHTLALKSDGTVWAWGYNGYGQLGDGTSTSRNAPVQVSGLTGVVAIAAGDSHSVAVKADGTAWAWGYNGYGQLGDGSTTNRSAPVQVPGVTTATLVAAGASHTLIGTASGVLAVGYNGYGQLGDGTTTSRSSPVVSSGVPSPRAIAAGSSHSLAVASDGTVWAWGYNGYGQLGDGTNTSRVTPVHLSTISNVGKLAAADHVLALKSDGTVWVWGSNGYGQLGDGSTTSRNSPSQVAGLSAVVSVAAGASHSLALTSSGVVYSWGGNSSAQLGDGTTKASPTPKAISGTSFAWRVGTPQFNPGAGTYFYPPGVTITSATPSATIYYTLDGTDPTSGSPTIASGGSVPIDRTQTLKVFAGKAGSPSSDLAVADYVMKVFTPSPSPYPSTYTTAQTVSLADSTPEATIHYTLDGATPSGTSPTYSAPLSISTQTTLRAYATKPGWSDSDVFTGTYDFNYGTLSAPTVSPAAGAYVSSVSVTLSCSAGAIARYTTDNANPADTSNAYAAPIVLAQTTTLKSACFQLDHATSSVSTVLYSLQVAAPALGVPGGSYPAGTQVTVTSPTSGATLHYTLDGTDPTTASPTIASGDALVIGNYTLKVKAFKAGAVDSAVTTATYSITGRVAALAVAAGYLTSYALGTDGTVWAWGYNAVGQLGDGTTSDRSFPGRVLGLNGIKQIEARYRSAYALREDGTVWVWGQNGGATGNALAPVQVPSLTGIVQIAAGLYHGLALKSDGTVWAWGGNSGGELGDGTSTAHTTPIQVPGLTGVASVWAGDETSFAIKGGLVYGWGRNASNETGFVSGGQPVRVPTLVSSIVGAVAIRGGGDTISTYYSLVLGADGSVDFIGYDSYRYLTGSYGGATPQTVIGASNTVDVSTAITAAMALGSDGLVMSWGLNSSGVLGDGTTVSRSAPERIPGLPPVVSVASGGTHSLALTADGVVYFWGAASQLNSVPLTLSPTTLSSPGLTWRVAAPTLSQPSGTYNYPWPFTASCSTPGAEIHFTTDGSEPTTSSPVWPSGTTRTIQDPATYKLKAFLAGYPDSNTTTYDLEFAPAVPDFTPGDGYVFSNPVDVVITEGTPESVVRYTLDGSEPSSSSTPYTAPIRLGSRATLKAAAFRSGWQPSATRTAVYLFNLGALNPPILSPPSGTFQGRVDVSISADPRGTVYYTLDGSDPSPASKVYTGPIPVNATTTIKAYSFSPDYAPSPKIAATFRIKVAPPVFDPPGGNYRAGQDISVSVETSGAVVSYQQGPPPLGVSAGKLLRGQVIPAGNFTLTAQATKLGCDPSDVVSQSYTIAGRLQDTGTRVALGTGFGLFIDIYGQLYSWGEGAAGQLGDGTSVSRRDAQMIARGTSFREIAAGKDHGLAVASDGSLWAWGANDQGQLGLGDLESREEPTPVVGLSQVIGISAGAGSSYAFTADGSLYAWGQNDHGQLGTGAAGGPKNTPVRIAALSDVTRVASGQQHVLAVTRSGDLYAWGGNASGQLGDGTTSDKALPTKVGGTDAFVAAAAGDTHSLAVTTAGKLIAFGDNTFGELGTGSKATSVPSPTPTLVSDASGAIAAGQGFSLACGGDGTCVGFGANDSGQLGVVGPDQPAPARIPTISGIVGLGAAAKAAAAVNSRGQLVRWGGATPLPYTDVAVSRASTQAPQPVITGYKAGQEYVWWGDDFTVAVTNLDTLDPHLTVGQFPGYAVQATSVAGPTTAGDFVATFKVPYDTRGGRFLYLSSRGRTVPVDNNVAPIQLSPPVTYNGILSVVGTDFKAPKKEGHLFVSDSDGVYDLDLFAQPFSSASSQKLQAIPGGQLLSEVTSDGKLFFVPTTTGNPDVMVLDIATGNATKWSSTTDLKDKTGAKVTFTAGAIAAFRDGSTVFIWDKDSSRMIAVFPDTPFFVLDEKKFAVNPDAPALTALNRDGFVAYNTRVTVELVGPLHGYALTFPIPGVKGLTRADTYFDNDPTQPNAVLWCRAQGCSEVFNPTTHRAASVTVNDARNRVLLFESSMWTARVVTDRVVVSNPSPTTGPIPFLSDAQVGDGVLSMKVVAPPWQTVALRVVDPPDTAPYVQPQSTAFRGNDNKNTSGQAGVGADPQGAFSRCLSLPPSNPLLNGDVVYQVYLRVPGDAAAGDNYRVELSMSPFVESECSGNGLPDRPLINYSGSVEVWRQIALEVDPMYRRGAPLARRASPGDQQVWLAKLNLSPGSATPSFQEVDNIVDGESVTIFGGSATGEGSEQACVDQRDPHPADAGPDLVKVTLKDCRTGLPYAIQGDYIPSYSVGGKDLDFTAGAKGISGLGANAPAQGVSSPLLKPNLDDLLQAFAGAYVEFYVLEFGAGSRPVPFLDEQWFTRKDEASYDWFAVSSFRNYRRGAPRQELPSAPNGDLPHATWHVLGATAGLVNSKGQPSYGLTARGYDVTTLAITKMERDAPSFGYDVKQITAWVAAHEFAHHFKVAACSEEHDDSRLAWTTALKVTSGEVCLMRSQPPTKYSHLGLAHFCVEELLLGDPACQGAGTSVSPRDGSIRGFPSDGL